MCSAKHMQEPTPFCSLQTAFEPHGDGTQGDIATGGGCTRIYTRKSSEQRSLLV